MRRGSPVSRRLACLWLAASAAAAAAAPALAQSDAGRALSACRPTCSSSAPRAHGPRPTQRDVAHGAAAHALPDGAQRLYVQWLAVIDPSEARMGVITTEEIPEVFDWRVGIEDYRVEPEGAGSRVLIDGKVLGSGQSRRYLLTIGPPGEVTFGATR